MPVLNLHRHFVLNTNEFAYQPVLKNSRKEGTLFDAIGLLFQENFYKSLL